MLERINVTLNYVIGSFLGVFIGSSIYKYYDYINHPGLYENKSALWYTSILISGLVAALIVSIAIVIKLLIKKGMRDI